MVNYRDNLKELFLNITVYDMQFYHYLGTDVWPNDPDIHDSNNQYSG